MNILSKTPSSVILAVILAGGLGSLLTGCATSAAHQAYLQELQTYEASPMVVAKAEKFEPLELGEIEELTSKGVADETILYHLRKSRAIYRLNTQDVERLRESGVSETIIDYMLSSPERFLSPYPPTYYYPYYYYGPYYPYYGPYYRPYYSPPIYHHPGYYHSPGIRYYPLR